MRQIQSELYESATMTNVYVLDCTLQIPHEIGTFRIISSDYKDGIFRIRFKLA